MEYSRKVQQGGSAFGITFNTERSTIRTNNRSHNTSFQNWRSSFDTIDVSLAHWTWHGPGRLIHFASSIHPIKDVGEEANSNNNSTGSYQLSSIWFVEVGLEKTYLHKSQGSMDNPDLNVEFLHFSCYFGSERTFGKITQQGRKEYLLVTCPIPPSYGQDLNSTNPDIRSKAFENLEETRSSIAVKFVEPPHIKPEKLQYVDPSVPIAIDSILLGRIPINWERQYQKHYLGSCTSPTYLDENTDVTDMLEWRIHQKSLGLEVVHWYGRNPALSDWVTLLNHHFNLKDTFRFAPYVNPHMISKGADRYHDQTMWYADCLARYSYLNEWIAITDLDEYILSPSTPTPFGSITKRLESLPEHVGVLNLFQSYFGGPPSPSAPTLSNYPRFPRDRGTRWTDQYKLPGDTPVRYPKSIHRTRALITMWVHAATSIANGYQNWDEEATAQEGNLLLVHSREEMYDGVEFIYDREVTESLVEFWGEVARELEGAEELRSWTPSVEVQHS